MRYCCSTIQATGIVLALVWTAGSAGCVSKYKDLKVFVQEHDHDVTASNYRIEPPDIINISSPTCPEVNGAGGPVGIDGKITLNLLGEVKVSGLTPKELASKLEELLSRYYVDPRVNTIVTGYLSKKIYVFGQVSLVGPQPFTGRDSLMNVLARATPSPIAWGSQVKVIRPSAKPGERREITVDVDKIMKTGDLRANILLQEGDIIHVPPTPLGWLGLRIQEFLFPFAPIYSAYTFPADVATAPKAYENLDERNYSSGYRGGYGYGYGYGMGRGSW